MRESEGEQGRYKAGNIHTNDKYREKNTEKTKMREKESERKGERKRVSKADTYK